MSGDLLRILIADDEPASLLVMRAALEKSGFEVSDAMDGEDALRQFRANPFDMVMMDAAMHGMDGYQLCAALRAEAGDELPIVMVTGMHDVESIEPMMRAPRTSSQSRSIAR